MVIFKRMETRNLSPVIETNANGCEATSVIAASVNVSPVTPTISISGQDLVSSTSSGNQWYVNGNLIAGATASIYTPTQNGIYTVVVSDPNGCSSTSNSLVYSSVGVEQFTASTIQIYPNPFSESTTISLSGDISELSLSIFDELGREIKRIRVEKHLFAMDVNDLDNGVYFVHIVRGKNCSSIHKIMVQK